MDDVIVEYLISKGGTDKNLDADFSATKNFYSSSKKYRQLIKNIHASIQKRRKTIQKTL